MEKNLFIVIEGLDATGKSTLVSNLAAALNAKLLSCPPCIEASELLDGDLRKHFDKRPPSVRRAYYRATNLIASELAVSTLTEQHVVMDRYWTSTVAFSAMDDGNEMSQWLGKYPLAIRPPDVLILLTVDENNRNKRMIGRGEPTTDEEYNLAADTMRRESVIAAYYSFTPIEIDTSNLNPEEVLQAALRVVENHITSYCNI